MTRPVATPVPNVGLFEYKIVWVDATLLDLFCTYLADFNVDGSVTFSNFDAVAGKYTIAMIASGKWRSIECTGWNVP